jgi:amino-acid N-acetyltransferase
MPTAAAVIEPARQDDFAAIVALLEAESLPAEDLEPRMLAHFLVARDTAGGLVGACGLEPHGRMALVRSLVVAPAWRGRGIAKRLVERIEERAQSFGLDELYLLTTTAADFFAGLGYRVIRRDAAPLALRSTSQFSRLCPAAAACLVKTL